MILWAMIILAFLALVLRKYEWKCSALGCDFHTKDMGEAAKHTAVHAKHTAKQVEVYT